MSDVKRELSGFDGDYANAEPPRSTPDGTYTVTVDDVTLRHARKDGSGDLCLAWKLAVVGGAYNGNTIYHRNRIADEQSVWFLKADLEKVGLIITGKLSEELPAKITDLLDKKLLVLLARDKTGKYQNVRILEGPAPVTPSVPEPAKDNTQPAPAAPAPAAPKKESEIPF